MANEFIARRGLFALDSSQITGSLSVTGSLTVNNSSVEFQVTNTGVTLGNISTDVHNATGSFNVSGSARFNGNTTITGSFTVTTGSNVELQVTNTGVTLGNISTDIHTITGSFSVSGSTRLNGNTVVTGSLTTTGTIVAQTLNVQQVTSSIVYSSGSNVFGNSLANTQQFTGSVGVTGSLTVAGAGTFNSSVTATTNSSGRSGFFGGTSFGLRIDNSGSFNNGGTTLHGVDNTFVATYQKLSINGSSLEFMTDFGTKLTIANNGTATFGNTLNGTSGNFSGNIQLGTIGAGSSTATPNSINLASTFSNTAGSNLKLKLFEDTVANIYGIGVSNNQMDFNVPSGATYRFYTGAATFSSSVTANGTMSLNNDGTYGSTYKTLGFTGNSNGSHRIFAGTADDMYFAAATARGFQFWTNGSTTTQMTITSGGNVLIGTTSNIASSKLRVNGNLQIDGFQKMYTYYIVVGPSSTGTITISSPTGTNMQGSMQVMAGGYGNGITGNVTGLWMVGGLLFFNNASTSTITQIVNSVTDFGSMSFQRSGDQYTVSLTNTASSPSSTKTFYVSVIINGD